MNRKEIDTAVKAVAPRFRHVAGDSLVWSQERQFALQVIGGNADLRRASPESVGAAVLQAATMGLSLNPIAGFCYLIPRRARKMRHGEDRAQYLREVPVIVYASPSYRGLIHLAVMAGSVRWVASEVIFRADGYEDRGPFEAPIHKRTMRGEGRNEADAIGVYCVARLPDGSTLCELMDRATVQKIRQMSEMPNGTMWNPSLLWTQGWRKAVIRRAWNSWPRSDQRMAAAAEVMNTHEGITIEGSAEEVEEPVIGDSQLLALHAILTDHDRKEPDKDLDRLARRFGVDSIADLPLSAYASARDVLIEGLALKRRAEG